MHKFSFMIFFAVFLSIYLGMHWYVYTHVVRGLLLGATAQNWLKAGLLAGGISFFAAEYLVRHTNSSWGWLVSTAGMTWIGVLAMAVTAFALVDLTRLLVRDPSYRYHATAAALVLVGALSLVSLLNAAAGRRIRTITVAAPGLPAKIPELSVVQLSDLHLTGVTPLRWLRKIVDQTNALDPDIVVITGDLVDADLLRFPGFAEELKRLHPRHGIYAVTGNHEYYTGIDKFLALARTTNITVLRNSTVAAASAVEIAGIDDDVSLKGVKAEGTLSRMLGNETGTMLQRPVILLSHRPDTFDAAAKLGVTLQLSGHTHAGQIPPIDFISHLVFMYPVGLYRQGASTAYVTTGTGWWGPPMRLFSRSELVKIVLRKTPIESE